MASRGGILATVAVAAALSAGLIGAQELERLPALRGLGPELHGALRADQLGRALSRSSGLLSIPVVLGLFSDSPPPHVSPAEVQAALFDGPAEHGTITEAYLEISRGALEVRGDVQPWVRTSRDLASVVGSSDGLGGDALSGAYFSEVLELLDRDVDFGLYDNDGPDGIANSGDDDGYVDIIAFEFLEISASCGGPAIWPHKWGLSGWDGVGAFETDDPSAGGGHIRVDEYITQSVTECDGVGVQDAAVMAHEFGHVLGLPDFYHPTVPSAGPFGRRWVLGCWALMAGGSWGCGPVTEGRPPFGPVHMSAYSKERLGWLEWIDVGEVRDQEIFLDPVQRSGRALRVPLGSDGSEFLIVEYRAHYGFDRQLPADGVLIYKLDLNARLRPDTATADPYFLSLVEQDANNGLKRNALQGGNRGEPGDAWGVGGSMGRLSALTTPSIRLSDGRATSVTLHEVSVLAGRARLVLSTAPTPVVVPPREPLQTAPVEGFSWELRIAGGTMPYSVSGEAPVGVALSASEDRLRIGGAVTSAAPLTLRMTVTDALGRQSPELTVPVMVAGAWVVTAEELMQRFLLSAAQALSASEESYLDSIGNANGRYDVGDLRRWLRENPAGGS